MAYQNAAAQNYCDVEMPRVIIVSAPKMACYNAQPSSARISARRNAVAQQRRLASRAGGCMALGAARAYLSAILAGSKLWRRQSMAAVKGNAVFALLFSIIDDFKKACQTICWARICVLCAKLVSFQMKPAPLLPENLKMHPPREMRVNIVASCAHQHGLGGVAAKSSYRHDGYLTHRSI